MASRICAASAAGLVAAALSGGLDFVPGLIASRERLHGQGASYGVERFGASEAGVGPATATALAACAVAAAGTGLAVRRSGRRTQRTAASARVITIDDAGRFRFAAPEEPLVPAEQPGATKPFGFFDPLGFSKAPLMTYEHDPNGFRHLRAAEIKHGRVAMMASVGSVFAHYVKFPGFQDVPTGLAAVDTPQGAGGFSVLLLCVGLLEAANWKPSKEPGSYGDPLKLGQYTLDMRNRELNNGRMAMFAMLGQIVAESVTGKDPVAQFGL